MEDHQVDLYWHLAESVCAKPVTTLRSAELPIVAEVGHRGTETRGC
jgi:hypothetical protein